MFVPAVVDAVRREPETVRQPTTRRRRTVAKPSGGIEIEINGVVVRVGTGANPKTIAAVIGALKGGS